MFVFLMCEMVKVTGVKTLWLSVSGLAISLP